MAHAHTDVYAEPIEIRPDEDSIWIVCGNTRICISPNEAIALRDQLANALTRLSIKRDARQVAA